MNVPTDGGGERSDQIYMERQIMERRIKDAKNEIREGRRDGTTQADE